MQGRINLLTSVTKLGLMQMSYEIFCYKQTLKRAYA